MLWLVGFGFWLAATHWLRLVHPLIIAGWFLLSAYLAVYLVAFVALTRVAVVRYRIPLMIAAPVLWVAFEWVRAHFLSGFAMLHLSHLVVGWTSINQIADLGGAYLVSALMMLVASAITQTILAVRTEAAPLRSRIVPGLIAATAVALAFGYSQWQLAQAPTAENAPRTARVGILQGDLKQSMENPGDPKENFHYYRDLTVEVAKQDPDWIVWPEASFPYPIFVIEDPKADISALNLSWEKFTKLIDDMAWSLQYQAKKVDTSLLLGIDAVVYGKDGRRAYNAAVAVSPEVGIGRRYQKVHPVAFGEYVPIVHENPWLRDYLPIPIAGIDAGSIEQSAVVMDGQPVAVNICFETTVPHLIRRQVAAQQAQGEDPMMLVNLTNDSWFQGTSELDLHFACGVYRAIECRKPLVISANGGFSSHIDSSGRIQWQGPRLASTVHVAHVLGDSRGSLYLILGDWPAALCGLATLLLVVAIILETSFRRRKTEPVAEDLGS